MLCELSGFGLLNMRRGGRSELQTQAEKRRGEGESRLASRLPTKEQMIPVRNATETDSLPCSPAREFATMLVFWSFWRLLMTSQKAELIDPPILALTNHIGSAPRSSLGAIDQILALFQSNTRAMLLSIISIVLSYYRMLDESTRSMTSQASSSFPSDA